MKTFARSLLLVFLLPYLAYCQLECPKLNGGYRKVSFLSYQQHLYPSLLPPSAPKGAEAQHTAGHIDFNTISFEEKSPSYITFYPTQDGTTYGYIQLLFTNLDFKEDTFLRIYNGTSTLGYPDLEVTFNNFSSHVGTTYTNNGPITLVFFGKTTEEKFGNYIRYVTGDVKISSCTYSRDAYIWKSYSPSDAYTVIDNMESATFNFMNGSHKLPVCMAYFNSAGEFVSSELSYSLDQAKKYPTVSDGFFPGEIIFSKSSDPLDIDVDGSQDNNDNLKIGRVLYLINKANQVSQNTWDIYQNGIWKTINNNPSDSFDPGSPEGLAQASNPIILTDPSVFINELDFDLSAGENNYQYIDDFIYLDLTYEPYDQHPATINLNFPSGIQVEVVSGGSITGQTLTLTNQTAGIYSAQIKVTSSTPGTYNLNTLLESDRFFLLENIYHYIPCNGGYSRFIALHPDAPTTVSRNVDVDFTALATPVTLSEFNVQISNQQAQLIWKTVEETNFSHFEIEKSLDLNTWTKIGEVISAGAGTYEFNDLASGNLVYYRLKMVDHDQTFSYSNIRVIGLEPTTLNIYPNPTSETLYFSHTNDIKEAKIFDGKGNLVFELHGSQLLHGVPLQHLKSGMYYLQVIKTSGGTNSEKFIIQK
jgi:hypothetical protein